MCYGLKVLIMLVLDFMKLTLSVMPFYPSLKSDKTLWAVKTYESRD